MTFSTTQAAEAAQVTLRQLQHWDEQELVQPAHVGHRREYSREDMLKLILIGKMRAKGLSLLRVSKVLRSMNIQHLEQNPQSVLIIRCGAKTRWMLWYDGTNLVDQLHQENGPVVVIAVAPMLEAITNAPKPKDKAKKRKLVKRYEPGPTRVAHTDWMNGVMQ